MTTATRPPARAAVLVARFHAIQSRHGARLRGRLARFLRTQAAAVTARYLEATGAAVKARREPDVDVLLPAVDEAQLTALILQEYEAVARVSGALAADLSGSEPFTQTDPRLQALLAEAGTRITRISDTTRAAIRRVLTEGGERHYSPQQIAHGVPSEGYGGLLGTLQDMAPWRAELLARTELADASQRAAHDRYGVAGVTEVELADGYGCGLMGHGIPPMADGLVLTLDEAAQWPLGHANCRRVSLPVLETRRHTL